MAKFCSYCGKALPEDGACDCAESAAAREAAAAASKAQPLSENAYVKKTREAVSQSVPFITEYWKEPMQATRRVLQEKNTGLAVVMMVLNALVTGLLLFTCFSRVFDAAIGSSRLDVDIPFFWTMLMGILIAAIALALSALALFIILKMTTKVDVNFQYVVLAVGVNSVLCTVFLVLALLFALFSWPTGVLVAIALSVVMWIILGVALPVKVFGAPISGLLLVMGSILFAVVLWCNLWLGSKVGLSAAEKIEIEGTEFGEAIEEIVEEFEDFDFEDLFRF